MYSLTSVVMCIMSSCDPVLVGHMTDAMDFKISFVNSVSASEPALILGGLFSVNMGNLSSVRIGQWSDSPRFSTLEYESWSFPGRKTRSMVDGWDPFSGKCVAHPRFWYSSPLVIAKSSRGSTKGEVCQVHSESHRSDGQLKSPPRYPMGDRIDP